MRRQVLPDPPGHRADPTGSRRRLGTLRKSRAPAGLGFVGEGVR